MRYYNGAPPETMRFGTVFPGANIQLIDKTTEVAPGITLIALVSDAPGTKEMKELSLAINTPDGIVLVVGCSHPGIETIVAETAKINPHIHFIAGGFHLVVAQDAAIEKAATSLHDSYKVDYIAPGHCTGEPTFRRAAKDVRRPLSLCWIGDDAGCWCRPRAESNRSAALTRTICAVIESCSPQAMTSRTAPRRRSTRADPVTARDGQFETSSSRNGTGKLSFADCR